MIFFSKGFLSQVEFALEAVKHGNLSIRLIGNKFIVLCAERKSVPKLHYQKTIRKIDKIEENIAIQIADCRSLRDYARFESQSFLYSLDTTPSVDYIARQIACSECRWTARR